MPGLPCLPSAPFRPGDPGLPGGPALLYPGGPIGPVEMKILLKNSKEQYTEVTGGIKYQKSLCRPVAVPDQF